MKSALAMLGSVGILLSVAANVWARPVNNDEAKQLVEQELFTWHATQGYDCDKREPDGGKSCRNIEIVSLNNMPVSEADKLNGVFQHLYVRYKFALFAGGHWIEVDNLPIEFYHSTRGWSAAPVD